MSNFTEEDAAGTQFPQGDATVISLSINDHNIYHVVVDGGNIVNILYFSIFSRMNLSMQ